MGNEASIDGSVCTRARRAAAALAALVALTGVACSSDGDDDDQAAPPPEADGGWARTQVWEHPDVLAYDRVAVGGSPETLAWVTRRPRGETEALAYNELRGDRDVASLDLAEPAPAAPAPPGASQRASSEVLIPVATATGDGLWAALAVSRDSPRGDNTGLVTWHGARDPDGAGANRTATRGVRLALPEGADGVPESAGIATTDDVTVAVALIAGEPVVWRSATEASASSPGRWALVDEIDQEIDGDLVGLRVAADRDQVVVAAVDGNGNPRLWRSDDGERWSAVDRERLPDSAGGVGLLTPVASDRIVVGWLADEESAPESASEVQVQSITGDEVSDEGTVSATDGRHDMARVDLNDVVLSPDDRLVVVGAAVRASNEITPMVWAQQGDDWTASEQTELAGRIDYEMRAAVAVEDTMVSVVTSRTHIDVECWTWSSPGEAEPDG